ncbi:MAG: hypothetical protein ABW189_04785 [Rickettsiales bacterium]
MRRFPKAALAFLNNASIINALSSLSPTEHTYSSEYARPKRYFGTKRTLYTPPPMASASEALPTLVLRSQKNQQTNLYDLSAFLILPTGETEHVPTLTDAVLQKIDAVQVESNFLYPPLYVLKKFFSRELASSYSVSCIDIRLFINRTDYINDVHDKFRYILRKFTYAKATLTIKPNESNVRAPSHKKQRLSDVWQSKGKQACIFRSLVPEGVDAWIRIPSLSVDAHFDAFAKQIASLTPPHEEDKTLRLRNDDFHTPDATTRFLDIEALREFRVGTLTIDMFFAFPHYRQDEVFIAIANYIASHSGKSLILQLGTNSFPTHHCLPLLRQMSALAAKNAPSWTELTLKRIVVTPDQVNMFTQHWPSLRKITVTELYNVSDVSIETYVAWARWVFGKQTQVDRSIEFWNTFSCEAMASVPDDILGRVLRQCHKSPPRAALEKIFSPLKNPELEKRRMQCVNALYPVRTEYCLRLCNTFNMSPLTQDFMRNVRFLEIVVANKYDAILSAWRIIHSLREITNISFGFDSKWKETLNSTLNCSTLPPANEFGKVNFFDLFSQNQEWLNDFLYWLRVVSNRNQTYEELSATAKNTTVDICALREASATGEIDYLGLLALYDNGDERVKRHARDGDETIILNFYSVLSIIRAIGDLSWELLKVGINLKISFFNCIDGIQNDYLQRQILEEIGSIRYMTTIKGNAGIYYRPAGKPVCLSETYTNLMSEPMAKTCTQYALRYGLWKYVDRVLRQITNFSGIEKAEFFYKLQKLLTGKDQARFTDVPQEIWNLIGYFLTHDLREPLPSIFA